MSMHLTFRSLMHFLYAPCLLLSTISAGAQPPSNTTPLLSDRGFQLHTEQRLCSLNDYFPLRLGDKWSFRIGRDGTYMDSDATLRVADMRKIAGVDVYTFERRLSPTRDVDKEYYSLDESGFYCHHMIRTDFNPPVLLVKSPIELEAANSVSTKVGGKDLIFTVTSHQDRVQVPAGEFDAIQVDIKTNTRYRFVYWFTPHIGFVKMSLTHGTTTFDLDLRKFETGTKE
jgi:hypothetical protein